jgi:hypothetical protein
VLLRSSNILNNLRDCVSTNFAIPVLNQSLVYFLLCYMRSVHNVHCLFTANSALNHDNGISTHLDVSVINDVVLYRVLTPITYNKFFNLFPLIYFELKCRIYKIEEVTQ